MSDAAVNDDRRRFRRTLLVFAFAGPLMGWLISLCVMIGIGIAQGIDARLVLVSMAIVGVVSLAFAPVVGLLPALSAGVVAGLLQRRGTASAIYYPSCALAGAVSSAPLTLFLDNGLPLWAGVGAATATICARLTRQQ